MRRTTARSIIALTALLILMGGPGCDRNGGDAEPAGEAEAPTAEEPSADETTDEPGAAAEGGDEAADEAGAAEAGGEEAPAGDPFPELTAQTLDGETVELGPTGEATLVNLWATWCAPCIAEFPEFRKLRERWGDKGLRLVGLSIEGKDANDRIATFVDEHEMPFDQVLFGPDKKPLEVFGGGAVPASFLYDADGHLVWWHGSMVEAAEIDQLEAALEKLLGSAPN